MIKLDRTAVDAPGVLTDPNGLGSKETSNAIEHYLKLKAEKDPFKQNAIGTFRYAAYRHPDVKNALLILSHNKCAYCESGVASNSDGDVEHFRPKGEVSLEGQPSLKPGYYWLAATWENLFYSCQHCNQSRIQLTPDGKKRRMGKKNQFPLSNERKRIVDHTKDIQDEEQFRLLLDPCLDNPEEHLIFTKKGIVKAVSVNGNPSPKGTISIEVFALYRKNLVEAREQHGLILRATLSIFRELVKRIRTEDGKLTDIQQKELKKLMKSLRRYTHPKQPFSLMSKQIISKYLSKMGIVFE